MTESRATHPADTLRQALVALPAIGLALGGVAYFGGAEGYTRLIFAAATIPVLAVLAVEIVESLSRSEVGLDVVAFFSMGSALLLGQELPGIVVAMMYAGGQFLENLAARRARHEMTALLARAPKSAMRHEAAGLAEVPIEAIVPGDRIMVRHGEMVPVDGTVEREGASLDLSALTGEAMPVRIDAGKPAPSGATNAGMAFDLVVLRAAAESTYAGIVRLVEAAEQAKAPMARLADRFALVFLAATLIIAGGAWIATGDPIRWLAVMVVATPCPLILAVPVAIIAGVSRAAQVGVLVKGGGALEVLGSVRAIVMDKTGTLTTGRAELAACHALGGHGEDEILGLAASLDQASNHVIAEALVRTARARGLTLATPLEVHETPGSGLDGQVGEHRVTVGGFGYVRDRASDGSAMATLGAAREGEVTVAVAIDGKMAGLIVLADAIRPEVPGALRTFRANGVTRIVLASGDRRDVTEAVAANLDIDAVESEMTPETKVLVVAAERRHGPVMMVGDGVNDAPALAAADIGVAMGVHGSAASTEAADAVLLVDRIDRLAQAMTIAQRARRIALESVYAGIGLSFIAMAFAAFGYLPPIAGALLQEVIDVAVILNALRVLGGPRPAVEAAGAPPTAAPIGAHQP